MVSYTLLQTESARSVRVLIDDGLTTQAMADHKGALLEEEDKMEEKVGKIKQHNRKK